jgi:transcriptional regulator with XRE-family HTH domain
MVSHESLVAARIITGNFIRERRKALGMRQEDLAERSGVSLATIKRAESGSFFLSLKHLWAILEALDLYFFMQPKNSPKEAATLMRENLDQLRREMRNK